MSSQQATGEAAGPTKPLSPLHSQRERDARYVHFGTRPPGRISCDNVVVFVYLDPVHDGDGGLAVLPGSCAALDPF